MARPKRRSHVDADGSQPSSFVQNFRPFHFRDGWGICTPTSDADFAGMCRAFGVDGHDDPRVATMAERARHRELVGEFMTRCYASAGQITTAEAIGALEANNVPCGVVFQRLSNPLQQLHRVRKVH
jgi:crotonobetainyl-CoA:carnitine CoA-transferase CaiB-like acyl-CoA transferase